MGLQTNSFEKLSQDILNISNKTRSNLFSWRGQFSPQFVETMLTAYAPHNAFVLDPFVGSGTVLYEAGKLQLRAFGAEINPAAKKLAQIYRLINKASAERESIVKKIDELLIENVSLGLPITKNNEQFDDFVYKNRLLKLLSLTISVDYLDLIESLIVRLDFYHNNIDAYRIFSNWDDLKTIIRDLPYSKEPLDVALCDARTLPLNDDTVNFVLTSPPYINVFNYHQQYRASTEAIGWDLLKVAKSEIGSNRKFRVNRFLTVIQFCIDIYDVLMELKRVCENGSQIIFVVGRESNVKKTRFFNGYIVQELATRCLGYELFMKQERVFKNKFGNYIYEDILHFFNRKDMNNKNMQNPRTIAKEILEDAICRVPDESVDDLYDAINQIDNVHPSQIFNAKFALC